MVSFNYHKLSKLIIIISISVILLFNIIFLSETNGVVTKISSGNLAPNFTVQDVFTNDSLSLSEFNGEVVILDLFATWCLPCKTAIPFIYRILYSYNPSDIVIISIDVDSRESQDLIKSFAEEFNMDWYVTMDNDGMVDSNYGTGYIPTMYIINQTGYIHYQEVGFNYEEVIASLDQLIFPDSILPILSGVQVDPFTTPLTMSDNKINISIQNVTDNYGIFSVYAEVTSASDNRKDQYPLHLNKNGTINQEIEIDPIQLYQETSIKIQIIVEDYRGNVVRSSEKTLSVSSGPLDEKSPSITSANITSSLNGGYYTFDIEIVIIDDFFIYKIELELREGSNPMSFKVSYKWGDIITDQMNYISPDLLNSSIFKGKFTIRSDKISNPEIVNVKVIAEDIGGNKTIFSSLDDSTANKSPWVSNYLFFIFFLVIFLVYKRNKK